MKPEFRLHPAGGQAMITRFECPNLISMLVILVIHARIKGDVKRIAPGFLGVAEVRKWRSRTLLSISLWQDIDAVYSMGSVNRHVLAARVPARLGVTTRCGVFCYSGDWRRVMFGGGGDNPSPLQG